MQEKVTICNSYRPLGHNVPWQCWCEFQKTEVLIFSPMVFQNKAWLTDSKWETPQGIQGTAAEGCTPAPHRLVCHTEPVVGCADGRRLNPHCGSHSYQRMCLWPLFGPGGEEKGIFINSEDETLQLWVAFKLCRPLFSPLRSHNLWSLGHKHYAD